MRFREITNIRDEMIREDYEKLCDNKFDSLVGEIPRELTSLQMSLNEK